MMKFSAGRGTRYDVAISITVGTSNNEIRMAKEMRNPNSRFHCALALASVCLTVVTGATAVTGQAPSRIRTRVTLEGGRWHINGAVTYPGAAAEGLLLNVRMVNAVFEDSKRKDFDPE